MSLRVVRLIRESGVIDRAADAAPSRAGPRRNVGSNYTRPRQRATSHNSARVLPIRNPFISLGGLAQPIRLRVQQPIERILDRLAHQFIQMSLNLLVVRFNCVLYFHTVTCSIFPHGSSLFWLWLSLQLNPFLAGELPLLKVRKISYVIGRFLLLGGSNVPNRDWEVNFRMSNRSKKTPTEHSRHGGVRYFCTEAGFWRKVFCFVAGRV